MTKKGLFTDRRWHEPPAVISLGYAGVSKNDEIEVLDFQLERGFITKEKYQKERLALEEEYKNIDPDKRI